jgi:CheY-like chemotaxis protein
MTQKAHIKFTDVEEVCIIDDDYVPRFLAQKIIGYELPDIPVKEFDNAEEALNYVQGTPGVKRLILLDLNMPVQDGWYFIENYNSTSDNNLLFILSSSDSPKDKEKAKQFQVVTDYLEKPLSIDQLEFMRSHF